jgi:hypothetical protein
LTGSYTKRDYYMTATRCAPSAMRDIMDLLQCVQGIEEAAEENSPGSNQV